MFDYRTFKTIPAPVMLSQELFRCAAAMSQDAERGDLRNSQQLGNGVCAHIAACSGNGNDHVTILSFCSSFRKAPGERPTSRENTVIK